MKRLWNWWKAGYGERSDLRDYLTYLRKRLKEGLIHEVLGEMRWIFGYSRKYKGAVILYIFLGMFGTLMGLGTGVVSKYIIDAVTGYDSTALVPAAFGYAVLMLFQVGVNAWSSQVTAKNRIMVNQEIRAEVFGKVLSADWESLSDYHSGDLLNRLNSDVNTVATSVLGWIPTFITGLFRFLATLGLIVYYDPIMAVLALASAPVTLAMSRVLLVRMRNHNKKMLEVSSDMMAFNEETFQNLQYIKAFGLMRRYDSMYQDKQDYYRDVQLDYNKFTILTSSLMSIVGMGVTGVCFGWGVYRLWTGAITYGTMTLFLQQAGNLSAAFSSLVNTVPTAVGAATSAGRVMAVTDLPEEEKADAAEASEFKKYASEAGGVTIRARDVEFWYQNGNEVLREASFHVKPREVVALVGPSGEGKTTLLRILLGLVQTKGGQVWAEAGDRKLHISPAARNLFAYVPQGNTMMSGTIRENLQLLKADATDEEIWMVLRETCAEDFVRKLPEGLDTYLKERGGGLSEGQLQRLSIARAMLCDAPVMLLDEATSALDVATERQLLRNIMESAKNKTCIVTTHRPSVLTMCTRVYRISGQEIKQLDEEGIRRLMLEF